MDTPERSLQINANNNEIYGDFNTRLGAILLDTLFTLPLLGLNYILTSHGIGLYIFSLLVNVIFFVWYHIYLVRVHGGTPGKILSGINIMKLDLEPAGWREAILRQSVELTLSLLYATVIIFTLIKTGIHRYDGLTSAQRYATIKLASPAFFITKSWLSSIWLWSELIVLLTDKKKRALHDFIAGTVVVKIKYLAAIHNRLN
jgi:uncharacterized RDD family membrane protein YckC